MEVVAAATEREAAGEDVLHLEVGQPNTGAPPSAVATAQSLLASGAALGYTPACGIAPLRARIARLYDERYGEQLDPGRVVVTAGASAAVVLALLAGFDEGDRVVVTEPGYPCYRQMIEALGLRAVPVRIGHGDGYLLGPDALDRVAEDGPVAGVVVASPANPTGTMYDAAGLAALCAWCTEHGALLVADEIYHGISFERAAPSAVGPDTIVVGSFSKYFSMTGWRLGWMVVPESFVEAVDRLSQNLYLSPPTLAQHAALAAFDDAATLDTHVERYAVNRRVLIDALTRAGVTEIAPADGAFYVYGDVSHWGFDSHDLVECWLADLGVATAPGVDFDPVDGHRWIRWSVAGATDDVAEAARRIEAWAAGRTAR